MVLSIARSMNSDLVIIVLKFILMCQPASGSATWKN